MTRTSNDGSSDSAAQTLTVGAAPPVARLSAYRIAGPTPLTVSFDDYVITSMVAGVDSETLPMVIYAMARRGASPVLNAISALITLIFGVLILISERVRET